MVRNHCKSVDGLVVVGFDGLTMILVIWVVQVVVQLVDCAGVLFSVGFTL